MASFGPQLLAKVLGANETQTSSLALVFYYADQQGLPLLDLADLVDLLKFLVSDEGKPELKGIGGLSSQTAGVLLRKLVELLQQDAELFFGEPEVTDRRPHPPRARRPRRDQLPGAGRGAGPAQAVLHVPHVAAGRAVRGPARGGRPRQAQAGVLLRRGPPALRRRVQGVRRPGGPDRAPHPLQGRGRVLRDPAARRRARRGAGPARQPGAARPAGLHPARRQGPQGGGVHLPEHRRLRPGGGAHPARDRRGDRDHAGRQRRPHPGGVDQGPSAPVPDRRRRPRRGPRPGRGQRPLGHLRGGDRPRVRPRAARRQDGRDPAHRRRPAAAPVVPASTCPRRRPAPQPGEPSPDDLVRDSGLDPEAFDTPEHPSRRPLLLPLRRPHQPRHPPTGQGSTGPSRSGRSPGRSPRVQASESGVQGPSGPTTTRGSATAGGSGAPSRARRAGGRRRPDARPRRAQRRGGAGRRPGLRRPRLLRLGDPHPEPRPPRRRRPAVHELPRDPDVLAHPGRAAHRRQPAPTPGPATWPTPTPASPATPELADDVATPPRSSATPATTPSPSASGTSPRTPTCPTPVPATRGRASAASTATTACSTPSPTSTTRTGWWRTTTRSTSTSTPRATTSPTTSPTGPSMIRHAKAVEPEPAVLLLLRPHRRARAAAVQAEADHRPPPGSLRRRLGRAARGPPRAPGRAGPAPARAPSWRRATPSPATTCRPWDSLDPPTRPSTPGTWRSTPPWSTASTRTWAACTTRSRSWARPTTPSSCSCPTTAPRARARSRAPRRTSARCLKNDRPRGPSTSTAPASTSPAAPDAPALPAWLGHGVEHAVPALQDQHPRRRPLGAVHPALARRAARDLVGRGLRDQWSHVTDLLPTLCELTGVDPTGRAQRPRAPARRRHQPGPVLRDPDVAHDRGLAVPRDGGPPGLLRRRLGDRHPPPPLTEFGDHEWELYDLAPTAPRPTTWPPSTPRRWPSWPPAGRRRPGATRCTPSTRGRRLRYVVRPVYDEPLQAPVRIVAGTHTLERYRSQMLIQWRSFTVDVDLRFTAGDRGVLVSHGDQGGGYAAVHRRRRRAGVPPQRLRRAHRAALRSRCPRATEAIRWRSRPRGTGGGTPRSRWAARSVARSTTW
jgi:hypothetical protein